jgi:hypothetical protein
MANGLKRAAIPADSAAQPVQGSEAATLPSRSWESIEIWFLSDMRVQIRDGADSESYNYAELGFEDGRSEKPNRAWALLRILAEHEGVIRDGGQTQSAWSQVEKRIQEIRKALQKHFRIATSPISFIHGTGYQTRFKIGCKRSFDT